MFRHKFFPLKTENYTEVNPLLLSLFYNFVTSEVSCFNFFRGTSAKGMYMNACYSFHVFYLENHVSFSFHITHYILLCVGLSQKFPL